MPLNNCFLCNRKLIPGEMVYMTRREGVVVPFCLACAETHIDLKTGEPIRESEPEKK